MEEIFKLIEKEYITPTEAAKQKRRTVNAVMNWMDKGNRFNKLPYSTLFGRRLILKKDLDNFIL